MHPPLHIHVSPFEIIAVNKQVTVDGTTTTRDLAVALDVNDRVTRFRPRIRA